jgi:hypothetical protein
LQREILNFPEKKKSRSTNFVQPDTKQCANLSSPRKKKDVVNIPCHSKFRQKKLRTNFVQPLLHKASKICSAQV